MQWKVKSRTELPCGCTQKIMECDLENDTQETMWYCDKHYYELNKDRLNELRRQRYQLNPERERERQRVYRANNLEKIRAREREKEREQRRLYPEICRAKQREFYEKNKERINTKRSESFVCACGGKYTRCGKAKHEKTKKHLQWVEEENKKKLIEEEKWCKIEPII